MKVSVVTDWLRQHQLASAILFGVLLAALGLLLLGQALAALLAMVVGALLYELERRNRRVRQLALRLSAGQALEKIEVAQGGWGELCRAINGLVQEQRQQERLHAAVPSSLAADVSEGTSTQHMASVLLIGCTNSTASAPGRTRRPTIAAWQALASATRQVAQQHGALLQPCGDALMLVFGSANERPIETSLLAAVASAERLQAAWQRAGNGAPLAFSVTSGLITVTTLPGLGCCVLGAPVEQALQIERLALASPFYHALCDEAAYYALRRQHPQRWRPTEFRIQSPEGRPQVVYGAQAERAN